MKRARAACGMMAILTACSGAAAQWYWPPTGGVGVVPECPHPTSELTVRTAGDWPDSCPPNIARVSVSGFDVDLELVSDPAPGFCLAVITPYAHEVDFGPLPEGDYTVYVTYFVEDEVELPRTRVETFTVDSACPGGCYADCDGSGDLDFFDFLCFQNLFAAGEMRADCDESGGLDFFDFLCFQNAFAAGCP